MNVALAPQYLDVPFDQVHALEQAALDGYIEGIRDAGWDGDEEDVRLGFLITASLFLGLGGAGLWFGMISADESVAARMIGRPVGEIATQWSQLHAYYLDLVKTNDARRLDRTLANHPSSKRGAGKGN